MLQLDNRTALKVALGVFPDENGVECAYAVIKATFAIGPDGRPTLADEQDDVRPVDEPHGDPIATSLKAAGEMTLTKPGTDVLLAGHAHAPGGKAARQVDVTLRVGPVDKTVRVFGDRVWEPGVLRPGPSAPKPFETIPLVYERAFGGVDPEPPDPSRADFEPRNPVGVGLIPRDGKRPPEGRPLPNLERPDAPIKTTRDRPAPAAFGPIAPHWEPRRSYAGTYDEAWIKKRAPYLPTDFDPRFFQAAPPDQVVPGYLKGGEPVELLNVTPQGRLAFALPAASPELVFRFDGRDHAYRPNLDTVCIDADAGRLWLIWRAKQVVDKRPLRLEVIRATCPEFPKRGGA